MTQARGRPSDTNLVVVPDPDPRRRFARAPLHLPTVLHGAAGERWETLTLDVSGDGVRLARPPGPDPGSGELDLEITVGDRAVCAQADVVRATAYDIGLRFVAIDRADRLLLAALTHAHQRRA